MGLFSRIESKLGVTRSDLTVASFLAATALVGFVWITFFEDRPNPIDQGREVAAMAARFDSISLAKREQKVNAMVERVNRAMTVPADSVPAWEPLTAADTVRDRARAEAEGRPTSVSARSVQEGGRGGRPTEPRPVNINTAPQQLLETLPGVGEKTAQRIIERRKERPFRRPEDIMEVKGIGEKKFEKMKRYVLVQ